MPGPAFAGLCPSQPLLGYARPSLRRGRFRGSKLGRGGLGHTETIRANAANGEPHKNLAAAPRPTTARLLIFNFNAGQGRAGLTPPAAPRCARLRHATYSRAGPRHAQSQASARISAEPHRPIPSLAALRLPHPGPARLHASGVEPARGPAFPLLISNRADANKGVQP